MRIFIDIPENLINYSISIVFWCKQTKHILVNRIEDADLIIGLSGWTLTEDDKKQYILISDLQTKLKRDYRHTYIDRKDLSARSETSYGKIHLKYILNELVTHEPLEV